MQKKLLHLLFGWCLLSMIWDWFQHFISVSEPPKLIFMPLEHVLLAFISAQLLTGLNKFVSFKDWCVNTNFFLHSPLCSPIITSQDNWFKVVCGNFFSCNFMLHYSNLFIGCQTQNNYNWPVTRSVIWWLKSSCSLIGTRLFLSSADILKGGLIIQ